MGGNASKQHLKWTQSAWCFNEQCTPLIRLCHLNLNKLQRQDHNFSFSMVELRVPQALLIYQGPRFYSEAFCFFLGGILEWVFCCLLVWDMVSYNLGWTGTHYVAKMILYLWSLWHPFQGAGVKRIHHRSELVQCWGQNPELQKC